MPRSRWPTPRRISFYDFLEVVLDILWYLFWCLGYGIIFRVYCNALVRCIKYTLVIFLVIVAYHSISICSQNLIPY
ncbi:hypothetical protein F5B22DRAFT_593847 [Xylaria bambusicola]|uniref:uncharacterized protein n=1 Tax=Xylaria bambusicola TaxID=326684 RepID=UPI0020077DF7|nr:uncharacterized protein F5B22DRAFT_593847 [Xylaria bambusicola]KAI0522308.1 hypothetical protein F5B22DRAFT_593847 [Xylaria bambusicola]